MFKLCKRLLPCANFVSSKAIVDVGTDHAKLPIWLVKNKIIDYALACDINKFSVVKSLNNVKKYALEDKIKVVLSDGLQNIDKNFSDTIVIAGLGGKTISKILRECPWSNKKSKKFILQPTRCDHDLRIFLAKNGFQIDSELVVNDGIYNYSTILSRYTGEELEFDDLYPFVGKIRPKKASLNYLERQVRYIEKCSLGFKSNEEKSKNTKKLLSKMKEFISKCKESE